MEALLSPYSAETQLAEIIPAYVPLACQWIAVRQCFDQFHQKLQVTLAQTVDGYTKLGDQGAANHQGFPIGACPIRHPIKRLRTSLGLVTNRQVPTEGRPFRLWSKANPK
jgi:hypothetical protein